MVFPELAETALIRELHVYGRTFAVGDRPDWHRQSGRMNSKSAKPIRSYQAASGESGDTPVAQHLGIGKKLLVAAENLAITDGYERIAVISGVGVRNYYERFGYVLEGQGEFMTKSLKEPTVYEMFVQLLGNLRIV